MPDRDVTLVANATSQALTLSVETFMGVTSAPKTVRYHFPPGMRGVVLFSHGTGGASDFIERTEPFALALALVADGYGVMSTESEETATGDLSGDGKLRWSTRFAADNVDLRNLQALFESLERRGLIPSGSPKFALGMSAGGAFSHFLGTIGATALGASFPQLRFAAVAAYCSDATAVGSASTSTTGSAWFMCGAEDNPEVSNAEARANEAAMRTRGIPTDYAEHPPSPLYDGRFTRIDGISLTSSRAMAGELRAAGVVNALGFITLDANQIADRVQANPGAFPTITAHPSRTQLLSQIKVMRAEHAMYADYTRRNIGFFDRFNPNPPAR
jgi:hypothetical protein